MISVQKPLREPEPLSAAVVTSQVQPHCAQCREPLPAGRAEVRANAALCADCALDGMPHTD